MLRSLKESIVQSNFDTSSALFCDVPILCSIFAYRSQNILILLTTVSKLTSSNAVLLFRVLVCIPECPGDSPVVSLRLLLRVAIFVRRGAELSPLSEPTFHLRHLT